MTTPTNTSVRPKGVLHCTRPGCTRSLPKGRHKYCGKECAALAQQAQLEAINVKRQKIRSQKSAVKCAIPACTNTLRPTNSSHKYCSPVCALQGLQLAIDRQRERRLKDKELVALAKKLRKKKQAVT